MYAAITISRNGVRIVSFFNTEDAEEYAAKQTESKLAMVSKVVVPPDDRARLIEATKKGVEELCVALRDRGIETAVPRTDLA